MAREKPFETVRHSAGWLVRRQGVASPAGIYPTKKEAWTEARRRARAVGTGAGAKLTELRHHMPDAGGLVIAPSIQMAEYVATLIELTEGERPIWCTAKCRMPNQNSGLPQYGQALDRVCRNDL